MNCGISVPRPILVTKPSACLPYTVEALHFFSYNKWLQKQIGKQESGLEQE